MNSTTTKQQKTKAQPKKNRLEADETLADDTLLTEDGSLLFFVSSDPA
jgi:hypothetical protein